MDYKVIITEDALKMCESQHLKGLGYRRINFLSHRYFMLHRASFEEQPLNDRTYGSNKIERFWKVVFMVK